MSDVQGGRANTSAWSCPLQTQKDINVVMRTQASHLSRCYGPAVAMQEGMVYCARNCQQRTCLSVSFCSVLHDVEMLKKLSQPHALTPTQLGEQVDVPFHRHRSDHIFQPNDVACDVVYAGWSAQKVVKTCIGSSVILSSISLQCAVTSSLKKSRISDHPLWILRRQNTRSSGRIRAWARGETLTDLRAS